MTATVDRDTRTTTGRVVRVTGPVTRTTRPVVVCVSRSTVAVIGLHSLR